MKALVCLVVLTLPALAQEPTVVERGQDFRVLELISAATTDTGATVLMTNRHTEIATGMHYSKDQEWKESQPVFHLIPGFATAHQVPHPFTVSANLNEEGAIVMETADGKVFRSTPVLLAFRDTATGESVVIGQIQDSIGEQVGADQIVYPNAMEGVACSLRYTIRRDGAEQELIIQEPLRPEDFGMENRPSIRLELWTAFYDSPALQKAVITDAGGMRDLFLDFGSIQIGQGKTFAIEAQAPEAPVAKRFGPIEGDARLFLVEMISQPNLQPLMNALEQAQVGQVPEKIKRLAIQKHKSDKEIVAAMRPLKRDRKKDNAMMRRTTRQLGAGVVLDYSAVSGAKNNYVFETSSTYSITGDTTLSGTAATFESGTVLKYAAGVKLTVNCPIVWKGTNYGPVVLTAANDHSVGEKINNNAGVTTNRFAKIALEINATTAGADAALSHVRICNAEVGIVINGRTGHSVDHAQFVNCGYGISLANTATTLLRNALFNNVTTNLSGSGCTVRAEHITSDGAAYFKSDLSICTLTNSLLVAVTTPGTFTSSLNVQTVANAAGVFKSVGSGAHYLADSAYRNQGTLSTTIQSAIARKTTYAPLVRTSGFTVDTVLDPVVQRDTDAPDLGWHYDVLDHCFNNLALSATVILTNGVAIGGYGSQAITISGGGARFISQGLPNNLNRIVRYNAVQEQPTIWGASSTPCIVSFGGNYSPIPEVRLRFTEVSFLGTGAAAAEALITVSSVDYVIAARDCLLRGVYLNFYNTGGASTTPIVALTNNIWTRPTLTVRNDYLSAAYPMSLEFRNNLLLGGSATFIRSNNASATFNVKDNLFDTVTLGASASGIGNSNNGYKSTTVMGGSSGGDIVLTSVDYQVGPLGSYYYNTTQSATNTAYLINKGSVANSSTMGFYHNTTQVNQTKEGTSALDIGFHYIATGSSGSSVPLDTDGDTFADYYEDANGNGGTPDSGETDWNAYTSPNGLASSTDFRVFTPRR